MKTTILRRFAAATLLAVCASADPLEARIELVTLPNRDKTEIAIYNTEDLTLVRETRTLTLRKEANRLEFSWAGTLIDPTSALFRPLDRVDSIDVLDATFPAGIANTLVWNIRSAEAGPARAEISYFLSGISWKADYVATLSADAQKMELASYVRVDNRSGEDLDQAAVRLVVGKINLVEPIGTLARRGEAEAQLRKPMESLEAAAAVPELSVDEEFDAKGMVDKLGGIGAAIAPQAVAAPKAIAKEGLSEYFLYDVEGTEDLPNAWAKRMPDLKKADIPVKLVYRYDPSRFGADPHRFLTVRNDKESGLGAQPLPDGQFQVLRNLEKGGVEYLGRNAVKYIPLNGTVEVDLGTDPELKLEAKRMNFRTESFEFGTDGGITGYDSIREERLEIKNFKSVPVRLEARVKHTAPFSMESKTPFEKEDLETVKFDLTLEPGEKRNLDTTITRYIGSRANNR